MGAEGHSTFGVGPVIAGDGLGVPISLALLQAARMDVQVGSMKRSNAGIEK